MEVKSKKRKSLFNSEGSVEKTEVNEKKRGKMLEKFLLNPLLKAEWHEEKNGKLDENNLPRWKDTVWWKCSKEGVCKHHEWQIVLGEVNVHSVRPTAANLVLVIISL